MPLIVGCLCVTSLLTGIPQESSLSSLWNFLRTENTREMKRELSKSQTCLQRQHMDIAEGIAIDAVM